jgi:hypothetical protein
MESEQEASATPVYTMPEHVLSDKEEELNESTGFYTYGQLLHVTFAIVNAKPSEMIRIPVEGYGEAGKVGRIERPTFEFHLAGPWYI